MSNCTFKHIQQIKDKIHRIFYKKPHETTLKPPVREKNTTGMTSPKTTTSGEGEDYYPTYPVISPGTTTSDLWKTSTEGMTSPKTTTSSDVEDYPSSPDYSVDPELST